MSFLSFALITGRNHHRRDKRPCYNTRTLTARRMQGSGADSERPGKFNLAVLKWRFIWQEILR